MFNYSNKNGNERGAKTTGRQTVQVHCRPHLIAADPRFFFFVPPLPLPLPLPFFGSAPGLESSPPSPSMKRSKSLDRLRPCCCGLCCCRCELEVGGLDRVGSAVEVDRVPYLLLLGIQRTMVQTWPLSSAAVMSPCTKTLVPVTQGAAAAAVAISASCAAWRW